MTWRESAQARCDAVEAMDHCTVGSPDHCEKCQATFTLGYVSRSILPRALALLAEAEDEVYAAERFVSAYIAEDDPYPAQLAGRLRTLLAKLRKEETP